MQITDLKKEQQIFPLFRLGFRPLFLFGAGFGVVAMALWMLNLQQLIHFTPYGGSYWWHSHEMLFGFACAIIVGFLLFRFFDIVKPWPISWLDKQVGAGIGIMIDDVVAGFFAAIVIVVISNLGFL